MRRLVFLSIFLATIALASASPFYGAKLKGKNSQVVAGTQNACASVTGRGKH